MKKSTGHLEKAKIEYQDSLGYALCELCNRRIECRECHEEPKKNEKYIMCDLNGLHYHKDCI